MKQKTNTRKRRPPRSASETQLAALRQSTTARKQATIERLRRSIEIVNALTSVSISTIAVGKHGSRSDPPIRWS